MNRKKYKFMLSLLPVAFALMACEGQQGSQGPAGPAGSVPVYIEASVANVIVSPPSVMSALPSPGADTLTIAVATILNTATLPGIEINGVSLSEGSNSPSTFFVGYDFPVSIGQTANLLVNGTQLNGVPVAAQASVVLPGGFDFLDPPPDQPIEIPVGAGFSTTWSASSGADAYYIYLWLDYDYLDASGNDSTFSCSWDTLLDATSITVSPDLLFPDLASIASVSASTGSIGIYAFQGPWREGDPSNITGDAAGAFYAYTAINRTINISGASNSGAGEINSPISWQQYFLQKTHELAQRWNP